METFGEASLGDTVEVPGNHLGVVMYVGPVQGREGVFLGIDLKAPDFDKGRNDGSHNGVQYFTAKGPSSGIFVPQGRCRLVETAARKERPPEVNRPSSRRSFSGISTPGSPRPLSDGLARSEKSDVEAAALQKLLNENAMLHKELEESQSRLIEAQRKNTIQVQEMDELMTTLVELEALQHGHSESKESKSSVLGDMQAFLDDRERKIEELRAEAESRRTEFRQVTEHQQATIDELKSLHQEQLTALQEKHDDIEERLLSSAGEQFVQESPDTAQMEVLQGQLLELSDELDALVAQQDRARQDIEIANSRIRDLEAENENLLQTLAESERLDDKARNSSSLHSLRHTTSTENLHDDHPQKRQTIQFLENEIRHLKAEKEQAISKLSQRPEREVPESVLEEMIDLKKAIVDLRQQLEESERDRLASQGIRAELEAERQARKNLEAQHEQMEDTLERTILHINSKSPRTSVQGKTPNKGQSKPPKLSLATSPVDPSLDLRSPRADRGQTTVELPSEGALFCEFCETEGHDIVSCGQVFGSTSVTPAKPQNDLFSALQDEDDDETY
ncbi:CLIP170 family protein Tip1 [Taphrina deformans PYCC 5710]|uniref:CLIP170 family protein Tip1 n=1 Tax=Taphrina deformans (strain PYCC 5710 / ATCC 11124 / CBS 356.35 / IMI 108563 / JCM 9778 / NBRC 8474) TaxID=1097556 RepID=R4X915_TAPDE|nr:CLIP170 family protein Tip1 [Taphrina deformans PYCC 5710]|eukprot:CCG81920.1 CLIP170 family protein Tip1 [Taphrina deformans PYCC 5710]